MRRFASDVLTARDIVLGFRADGLDSARRVAPYFRRHVYLIFKESVNNAAKHSGCARVEVSIEFTEQGLFLQVKDDGRGFDPADGGEGHGLETLQHRARVLGAASRSPRSPARGRP
jgi:signal transduction histidine kinase